MKYKHHLASRPNARLHTVPFRFRWSAFLLLIVLSTVACHRGYYRRMADAEAQQLVKERNHDPRWSHPDGSLEIDPQSRMFDPFSLDHPPLPPDDEAAHRYMHRVAGRKNYPHWHANGDTDYVENPEWLTYLPLNENGEVVLDLDTVVELAFIHSPTFQRQREELYLSALDVALERFGFDSQLFAGLNPTFGTQGRFRPGGSQSNLGMSLGATGGGINYRKVGATGTTFVVGIANSILWNFAGPNTQSATSLINFSLVQPLLRNGGRERILASLTFAERNLLGNVRQFERFRQGYYLEVVIGRTGVPGVSRGGSFLGTPPAATLNAGGFFGLLQSLQNIRIQEFNVRQLNDVAAQFEEFFQRGRINNALQVRQAQARMYTAQAQLMQSKVNYQNDLERFVRTLGLPPELDVVVQDDFLGQFEFISDSIRDRLWLMADLRQDAGLEIVQAGALLPSSEDVREGQLQIPGALQQALDDLLAYIDQAVILATDLEREERQALERDFQKLEAVREGRLAYLAKLRQQVAEGRIPAEVNPEVLSEESIQDPQRLRELLELSMQRIGQLRGELQIIRERIVAYPQLRQQMPDEQVVAIVRGEILNALADRLSALNTLIVEVSLVQAQARSSSIEMIEVDLDMDAAVAIAQCFRLDWMNARMSLVDSWRDIELFANQLESQLDFVLEGSMGNVGDNPFRMRYENGNLRGGIRFDSPLTRLAERNQYRQALLRYQQAKRSYYQFEDEVSRNLRLVLRTIDLQKILFELQRRNVRAAIEQVENAQLQLERPIVGAAGGQGGGLGATAANDLTNALNNLQQTQSEFLRVWVTYEVLRRNLDFDLGTFRLDEGNRWIDPGRIDGTIGHRVAAELGLDPSCLDCALPEGIQSDTWQLWLREFQQVDDEHVLDTSVLRPTNSPDALPPASSAGLNRRMPPRPPLER